ncbi:MOSC domain-containing protein [Pseudorhodoferax sp. Leaf267]|uniref:MOSC domain-containing protein n=1 Tax=Pseudorhodoferax sp. Leaf267 TaxID=1736316 RepID=UPI0006F75AE7|nr:MOSC N-terminal beta barrel domain-containing protein [Pseudorhodoferax sp. Leaf267]KQP20623.1 Fe-S protein [Pseudorhodoferax sp. Leaf267]
MTTHPSAAAAPARDVQARIARLFIYPIKSCAGIEVPEALLTETGLEFDRAWMVVDEQGVFVTQRECPRMALVRPQLKHFDMVLRAPGMLALHIALDTVEAPVQVRVWKDQVQAYDMGDVAAQWFSDFLNADRPAGTPARALRLVRFDPEQQRLSNKRWTGDIDAPTQFADGFAALVLSQASLDGLNQRLQAAGHAPVGIERFRPNIVLDGIEAHDEDRLDVLEIATADGPARLKMVKPCPRCPIPNIDPATALSSPEVGDAMQAYRALDVVGGAIAFGMNAIVLDGIDHALRPGQQAGADYRFD